MQKVTNGVYYSPEALVQKCLDWINSLVTDRTVFLDLGCGAGAFCRVFAKHFPKHKVIGVDIDAEALKLVPKAPNLTLFHLNCLTHLNRENYGIKEDAELIIIGNPPYNNLTQNTKDKDAVVYDTELKARDLGLMFCNLAARLNAKYLCFLHPFAHLIKRQKSVLFDKYTLMRGYLFSSQAFVDLKHGQAFSCGLFLYRLGCCAKQDFMRFSYALPNGEQFIPSNLCTVKTIWPNLQKYPHKNDVLTLDSTLFYTLRDLNAVLRNKTFLSKYTKNALILRKDTDLTPYRYIAYVKKHAKVLQKQLPWWLLSNFDVFCCFNFRPEMLDDEDTLLRNLVGAKIYRQD